MADAYYPLPNGSNGQVLTIAAGKPDWADPSGGAGTANGILKADGSGNISAAVTGTDYLAPGGALGAPSSGNLANCTGLNASNISSGTLAAARGGAGAVSGIMKANGAGVVSAAVAGTDYASAAAVALGTWESDTTFNTGARLLFTTQNQIIEFYVLTGHTSSSNPFADLASGKLRVVTQNMKASHAYVYPSGWSGHTPTVFIIGAGDVSTLLDTTDAVRLAYMVKAGSSGTGTRTGTYYVSPSGNDDTGTGTRAAPYATILQALSQSNCLTVRIIGLNAKPSTANILKGLGTYEQCPTFSCNIIAEGPVPAWLFYYDLSPTFTVNGSHANVYQCTLPTGTWTVPLNPYILDHNGLPSRMQQVSSVAEVANGVPGLTYYNDGATTNNTIYVCANSTPVIGTDILVSLINWYNAWQVTANNNTANTIYIENTAMTTGHFSLSNTGGVLVFNNCAFLGGSGYPGGGGAVDGGFNGQASVVIAHSKIAHRYWDGIDYQQTNTPSISMNVLEIYNEIYDVGWGDTTSNQSSSAHTGVNILRIGGQHECASQNSILDVGDHWSINIGVKIKGGFIPASGTIACAGSRTMYNVVCTIGAVGPSGHYRNDSTSPMVIDCQLTGVVTSGPGVVTLPEAGL